MVVPRVSVAKLFVVLVAGLSACAARAQPSAPFYANKTVTLVVGATRGGSYAHAGRTIARHFGRHIPGNPNVIVQNLPGAAGLASVNRLGKVAERDGITLLVMSRALPQLALAGDPNAAFDPLSL